jgi:hypothetical protein
VGVPLRAHRRGLDRSASALIRAEVDPNPRRHPVSTKRLVEWKKPSFHNVADLFVLKPGANEIEAEQIEKALEIDVFRWYVAEGIVVLGKEPAPQALAKLKPADAAELVKRTVDRELLERWYNAEKRKPVQDALIAQLEAITPKSEPKSETVA